MTPPSTATYHAMRKQLTRLIVRWVAESNIAQKECGAAMDIHPQTAHRMLNGKREIKLIEFLLLMEKLDFPETEIPQLLSKLREDSRQS